MQDQSDQEGQNQVQDKIIEVQGEPNRPKWFNQDIARDARISPINKSSNMNVKCQ